MKADLPLQQLQRLDAVADLDKLHAAVFDAHDLDVSVLRLDRLFPELSGNKFFKLKYNLQQVVERGYKTVISFGGAYSNHLHALGFACQHLGVQLVAVVRGERATTLSPTLNDIEMMGGRLHFVSRECYRRRDELPFQSDLLSQYPGACLIPEGGSNALALRGSREIVDHIRHHLADRFDTVLVACGTGATAAGITAGLSANQRLMAVSVLKSAFGLAADIQRLLDDAGMEAKADWQVLHDYARSGYGKCDKPLAQFIDQLKRDTGLETEPVYTGKLLMALFSMAEEGVFKHGERIVVVHTGGMQGLRGMQERMQKLLKS